MEDDSCQRYDWVLLFVFMVAMVEFLILVSYFVEGIFLYKCTRVVLLIYHWILISICVLTILLLVW